MESTLKILKEPSLKKSMNRWKMKSRSWLLKIKNLPNSSNDSNKNIKNSLPSSKPKSPISEAVPSSVPKPNKTSKNHSVARNKTSKFSKNINKSWHSTKSKSSLLKQLYTKRKSITKKNWMKWSRATSLWHSSAKCIKIKRNNFQEKIKGLSICCA